jgi:protein-disulfide isomerase/uncharacterized membrane protein
MLTRALLVLLRLALLVAIVASTALVIDYSRDSHAFCGRGSGCAVVAASPLSHVAGVALPNIGLGVFAGLFLAVIAATKRAHLTIVAALLALSALGAIGLIAYQLFVLHAVCGWCMAVDVSVIVAAAAALAASRRELPPEPVPLRLGWLLTSVAAVAAPAWWAGAPITRVDLPPPLAELQQKGCTNIVTFTDFQCPYCRKMHAFMHERIARAPTKYCTQRLMVPLQFHPGADPAARAYVCADPARREEMADKLYHAEDKTMTREGMIALAVELGYDKDKFARCYEDKSTTDAIARDTDLYKALDLPGLPSTFVNDVMILGADFRAMEQALGGRDIRWMFASLAAAFALAAAASLKRR